MEVTALASDMEGVKMLKTMRWFGPQDPVSLLELRQAGCEGIVSALHQVPVGEVWSIEAIEEHQQLISAAGLKWVVVESLPVHEDIKRGKGNRLKQIENYKQSIRNLAACGIHVITYNFMPVLDWIRTDHHHRNPDGSLTLSFDSTAFACFDIHLLKRPGADESYSENEQLAAAAHAESLSENQRTQLFQTVLLGLPGSSVHFTPEQVLSLLDGYSGIKEDTFRENLIYFLEAVVPVAEEAGSTLAIHPDDPPFSLLGLPRIMSTMDDAVKIFNAVPSLSNGLCFCSGSLGAHEGNLLPAFLDAFQDRIHFLHLRNVLKSGNRNFRESPHLDGDNPMEEIIEKILQIMKKRNTALPVRPDHGFLFDAEIHKDAYPGYSLMGRMKGLAEITGLETGILFKLNQ